MLTVFSVDIFSHKAYGLLRIHQSSPFTLQRVTGRTGVAGCTVVDEQLLKDEVNLIIAFSPHGLGRAHGYTAGRRDERD